MSAPTSLANSIQQYRAEAFRTRPGRQIHTITEAIQFINTHGFIFFWPIKGYPFPSLWAAVAGDRPVADEHDDPAHITWSWIDTLLSKRQVYYARILRRRNTFISLEMLPYFYALSHNYGDWEQDYFEQYQAGTMTAAAKSIYEALLREGPLNTIVLRKASQLSSQSASSLFTRALDELIQDFKILPVGVSDAGAWHYCHIYDIVPRFYPALQEISQPISTNLAQNKILEKYMLSMGASSLNNIRRFFKWSPEEIEFSLQTLSQDGKIQPLEVSEMNMVSDWILQDLLKQH